VRRVILEARQHLGAVALLSILGLMRFSTGVFSTTGIALNRVHGC